MLERRGVLIVVLLGANVILSLAVAGWAVWAATDPEYWFPDAFAEEGPRGDEGPRGVEVERLLGVAQAHSHRHRTALDEALSEAHEDSGLAVADAAHNDLRPPLPLHEILLEDLADPLTAHDILNSCCRGNELVGLVTPWLHVLANHAIHTPIGKDREGERERQDCGRHLRQSPAPELVVRASAVDAEGTFPGSPPRDRGER